MLAFATVDLGLSESEFWMLTPAQYCAYAERVDVNREKEDYKIGVLTSIIRRIWTKDKEAQPLDLFPWHDEKQKEAKKASGVKRAYEGLKALANITGKKP